MWRSRPFQTYPSPVRHRVASHPLKLKSPSRRRRPHRQWRHRGNSAPLHCPAIPSRSGGFWGCCSTANRDLRGVDYGKLTRGGKESYDQAKGFVEEAEKALKERNFVYAQTAADKAAKLANELLGR